MRYRVDARMFRGTLAVPEVDVSRTSTAEDRAEAFALADELSGSGYSVWLYEQDSVTAKGPGPYRVIAEWRPGRKVS